MKLQRAQKLAWVRDNVFRANDEINIIYVQVCGRQSFSGLAKVGRWAGRNAEPTRSGIQCQSNNIPMWDLHLYRRLFGSEQVSVSKGSRSLEELLGELKLGEYDVVISSYSMRWCLQHSSTVTDYASSAHFDKPIIVLPDFAAVDDAMLVKQTCMECGSMDMCDSVSRTCVRCLKAPVNPCRPTHVPSRGKAPRKIAIGVSGSPDSFHAFSWALHHVAKKGDVMVLIHIESDAARRSCTPQMSSFPTIAVASKNMRRSPLPPESFLDALSDQCQALGLDCIKVMTEGKPTQQLVDWCNFHSCDMAVVGSRGLQIWFDRALRKSVSRYAVKHAAKSGTGVVVVPDTRRRHAAPRVHNADTNDRAESLERIGW